MLLSPSIRKSIDLQHDKHWGSASRDNTSDGRRGNYGSEKIEIKCSLKSRHSVSLTFHQSITASENKVSKSVPYMPTLLNSKCLADITNQSQYPGTNSLKGCRQLTSIDHSCLWGQDLCYSGSIVPGVFSQLTTGTWQLLILSTLHFLASKKCLRLGFSASICFKSLTRLKFKGHGKGPHLALCRWITRETLQSCEDLTLGWLNQASWAAGELFINHVKLFAVALIPQQSLAHHESLYPDTGSSLWYW